MRLILARIIAFGIGGAGTSVISQVYGTHGITCAVVDSPPLSDCLPRQIIAITPESAFWDGESPDLKANGTLSSGAQNQIHTISRRTDFAFILAGLGRLAGTAFAPLVAANLREMGIFTVAVVSIPREAEGPQKARIASQGLACLAASVDAVIRVNTECIARQISDSYMKKMFFPFVARRMFNVVNDLANLLAVHGELSVDFDDIVAVLKGETDVYFGSGIGAGSYGAIEAAMGALDHKQWGYWPIEEARRILINISGDISLSDADEAASLITGRANESAEVLFGAYPDQRLKNVIKVTVYASRAGL